MAKLTIFQQVRDLKEWQACGFALVLLERMYPNYQLFCELTEFSDAKLLRNSLNSLWEWLAIPGTKINFEAQREKLEEATPDLDQFDSYGVYPALDFAVALDAMLNLVSGEDPQGAVVISKVSQGSVEAYIEASEGQTEDVKSHPLMAWEIAFQGELLDKLAQGKRDKLWLKTLRQFALTEGISNIGLEVQSSAGTEAP